jgi:hypothetical protein
VKLTAPMLLATASAIAAARSVCGGNSAARATLVSKLERRSKFNEHSQQSRQSVHGCADIGPGEVA